MSHVRPKKLTGVVKIVSISQKTELRTLAVAGTLAALAPWVDTYLGLALDVGRLTEIVDHVIPGGFLIVGSFLGDPCKSARVGAVSTLVAPTIGLLAGCWITATHLSVVRAAFDDAVPLDAAVFHFILGPVLIVVSSVFMLMGASRPEPSTKSGPPNGTD